MVVVVKVLEKEGEAPKKARNRAKAVNKNSTYHLGSKINMTKAAS